MEELHSVFVYQQEEREHEQPQKLIDTILELEAMKKMNRELHNQLKIAYQERDEARDQLQKLINKFCPIDFHQEHPFMFHSSKPNSSITESSTLSYSSPSSVDSFFETPSSSMFSNTSMGYINHHPNQGFNYVMEPIEEQVHDFGSEYIDSIAKERVLPQKGKLLRAVIDAGPLLQTILLEGSLPRWRNPPHLQDINNVNVGSTSSLLDLADNHLLGSSNNSLKYSSDSSYNSSFNHVNSKKHRRHQ
ncbi:uncharacterized protein LOC131607008 [Vicia villosa]|uniref:uncharacterized protein LOC131607008 n=1 Tax=Vicia villosa TaxID=3911 RepID=UPI00273B12F0|nr:uncharacterized protein LOC131607008 [Vicia villosa]